jgi:hypothetical protein
VFSRTRPQPNVLSFLPPMALQRQRNLRNRFESDLKLQLRSFITRSSCNHQHRRPRQCKQPQSRFTSTAVSKSPGSKHLISPSHVRRKPLSKAQVEWKYHRPQQEPNKRGGGSGVPRRVDWRLRAVSQTGKFTDTHMFKRRIEGNRPAGVDADKQMSKRIELYKKKYVRLNLSAGMH